MSLDPSRIATEYSLREAGGAHKDFCDPAWQGRFGWIDPDGKAIPIDESHTRWADRYIKQHNISLPPRGPKNWTDYGYDYLLENGWVRVIDFRNFESARGVTLSSATMKTLVQMVAGCLHSLSPKEFEYYFGEYVGERIRMSPQWEMKPIDFLEKFTDRKTVDSIFEGRVASTPDLGALVEEFAEEYSYPVRSCDLNRGDCDSVSNVFADFLEDKGIRSHLLQGEGFIPPLGKDAEALYLQLTGDAAFQHTPDKGLMHVVVQVEGGQVVDLTGRQFGSAYADPIYSLAEFKQRWQSVSRPRRSERRINKIRQMLLRGRLASAVPWHKEVCDPSWAGRFGWIDPEGNLVPIHMAHVTWAAKYVEEKNIPLPIRGGWPIEPQDYLLGAGWVRLMDFSNMESEQGVTLSSATMKTLVEVVTGCLKNLPPRLFDDYLGDSPTEFIRLAPLWAMKPLDFLEKYTDRKTVDSVFAGRVASNVPPNFCWKGTTSFAWIDPDGGLHPLTGSQHHPDWAEKYLLKNRLPLSGDPQDVLEDMGWVRVLNAYNFSAPLPSASEKVWATIIRLIVRCAQTPTVDVEAQGVLWLGDRTHSIADFVTKYGTRHDVDALYKNRLPLAPRICAVCMKKYTPTTDQDFCSAKCRHDWMDYNGGINEEALQRRIREVNASVKHTASQVVVTGPHPDKGLSTSSNALVFNAQVGEAKAGYILLEWGHDPRSLSVATVYTEPDFRRQGVSSHLHDAAWDYARKIGVAFKSGWVVSQENQHYWEKLEHAGHAVPHTDSYGTSWVRNATWSEAHKDVCSQSWDGRYGWIDPEGNAIPIDTTHLEWAEEYLAEHGVPLPPKKIASDYLREQGWVRVVDFRNFEAARGVPPNPAVLRTMVDMVVGCLKGLRPKDFDHYFDEHTGEEINLFPHWHMKPIRFLEKFTSRQVQESVFEGRTASEDASPMTPKDIHSLADELDIPWDDDPDFMAFCEQTVGEQHLDDMTPEELDQVAGAMRKSKMAAIHTHAPSYQPTGKEPWTISAHSKDGGRYGEIRATIRETPNPIGVLDWVQDKEGTHIGMVSVSEKFRRQGVATQMYKKLFQELGITESDLLSAHQTEDGRLFRENARLGSSIAPLIQALQSVSVILEEARVLYDGDGTEYLAWMEKQIDPLVKAVRDVDIAFTGKHMLRGPSDAQAIREVLEVGRHWEIYLSDGGYSRLVLHGPSERGPVMHFDPGLAGPTTKPLWDALVQQGYGTPGGHIKMAVFPTVDVNGVTTALAKVRSKMEGQSLTDDRAAEILTFALREFNVEFLNGGHQSGHPDYVKVYISEAWTDSDGAIKITYEPEFGAQFAEIESWDFFVGVIRAIVSHELTHREQFKHIQDSKGNPYLSDQVLNGLARGHDQKDTYLSGMHEVHAHARQIIEELQEVHLSDEDILRNLRSTEGTKGLSGSSHALYEYLDYFGIHDPVTKRLIQSIIQQISNRKTAATGSPKMAATIHGIHITSDTAAKQILQHGFHLGGGYFGPGIYLALTLQDAIVYGHGKPGRTSLMVEANPSHIAKGKDYGDIRNIVGSDDVEQSIQDGEETGDALGIVARKAGFDGMLLTDPDDDDGGPQIVLFNTSAVRKVQAFDPENVPAWAKASSTGTHRASKTAATGQPCEPNAQGVAWISPEGRWYSMPYGIGHGTWVIDQIVYTMGLFHRDWRDFVTDPKAVAAMELAFEYQPKPDKVTTVTFVHPKYKMNASVQRFLSERGLAPNKPVPLDTDIHSIESEIYDYGYDGIRFIERRTTDPLAEKQEEMRIALRKDNQLRGKIDDSAYYRLFDLGWIRVANLWNITLGKNTSEAAGNAWGEYLLECIKPGVDVESQVVHIDGWGTLKGKMPVVEAVQSLCSKVVQEKFWGRVNKTASQRVFYRGKTTDQPLRLNTTGVLWMALTPDVAKGYGDEHWHKGKTGALWTITLKPSAKIIEFADLSNPVIRKLQEMVSEVREFNWGPISDEEWVARADFGMIEAYPWISSFLRSRRVSGVFIGDNHHGASHPSLALFTLSAIAEASVELFDRGASRVASKYLTAKYQSKKTIKTKDGDPLVVYEYSDRQVQNRDKEKAERLEKLRHSIDDLMGQVRKDIGDKEPKKRLTALAVALIDSTFERVGNESSADEGHFGVTGWLKEHLSFSGGKAKIKYTGKSGVDHVREISDKKLVTALKGCCEDKKPGDPILSFGKDDSDGLVKITSQDVNEYLKPYEISAKDLRGHHCNDQMKSKLKEVRKKGPKLPVDKKEREKLLKDEFKEALDATAEIIGHTPNILRKSYLVPGLEGAYLKDGTIIDKLKKSSVRVASAYLKQADDPCTPGGISAAWISPDGKVHEITGGQTHREWAYDFLAKDHEEIRNGADPRMWLLEAGWVRIANYSSIEARAHPALSEKAMQAAVEIAIGCAARRHDDPEHKIIYLSQTPGYHMEYLSLADFVREWGGKKAEALLFERLTQ